MPFFSVIIPTYNRAALLPKAIRSVLDQTFTDWELIIVDDGSTDNTEEVVASFEDQRIHYIYQDNAERSAARNKGIENATGEFICFLDSDDWYEIDLLEKRKAQLDAHPEKKQALFYSELRMANEEKSIEHFPQQKENESTPEFLLRAHLFCQQVTGHYTIFDKFRFDEDLRIGEDLELWIRISSTFDIQPLSCGAFAVVNEHEQRSINVKHSNPGLEELKTLSQIFTSSQGNQIRQEIRNERISNTYFTIAKHFMFQGKKREAKRWILKSVLKKIRHPQIRHRLYCLFSLFKGLVPEEYQ